MRHVALIICFLVSVATLSQTIEIKGNIQDTSAHTPLKLATVTAVKLKDSTLVKFSRSNDQGLFILKNLPIDTYEVVLSHKNFGDQTFILAGSKENNVFDLGKIVLPPKNVELNEVVVYAYKDPIYFKGDTLVYIADSFKVRPNATVEDLLKRLPGMSVDANGKIKSQGKEVDKVLVDGDEFFGTDPTVATRNLSATNIESVQVYEKKNDTPTGDDASETIKVLDLKLKEDSKKGYFGKASAAGDFNKYHEYDLLANKFSNKRKISVFALESNTPKTGFGWQDANKYGLNNEFGGSYNEENESYSWNNNNQGGVPQTLKSGFYFNDKPFQKTKISTDYTYNQSWVSSTTETRTQTFLTDTSFSNLNVSGNRSESQSHKANIRLEQKIDSLTDLEVVPRINFSWNNQSSQNEDDFFSKENVLTRKTTVSNENNSKSNDVSSLFKLIRRFKKKDRMLRVTYNYSQGASSSVTLLDSRNTGFNGLNISDTIRQKKIYETQNQGNNGALTYTEPLTAKVRLEFSYDFNINTNESHKKSLDFFGGEYSKINALFSNNFETTRNSQRAGIKYTYETKKVRFNLGARARQVFAKNTNTDNGQAISQTINNILPYTSFRYRISDNKSFDISYRTNAEQPSLTQLQPLPDNTNPNLIKLGNPDLLPTFNHGFSASFNSYQPISGRNIWASAGCNITNNDISNSSDIDNLGRTTTQTINVNGNYDAYANVYISFPLGETQWKLNPNVGYNTNQNKNYINKKENITREWSTESGLSIDYNSQKINFSAGGSYNYREPSSTISSSNNKPYSSFNTNASFTIQLPKKFLIQTDVEYMGTQNRSSGYNINYTIWNFTLSKAFLKTENLILSINANDILNQNQNVNREIQDNKIIDTKGNVVQRYILAKIVFKFNSTKTKDEDEVF